MRFFTAPGLDIVLVHQILQGDGFKKVIHHFIQPFPHGKCPAAGGAGAGGGTLGSAGYCGEAALGQLQNTADGIILRLSVQPIAAAFAVNRIHETGFGEHGHDGFNILLGNALFLGDLLQGDVIITAVEGKADHNPQSIAPFC